MENLQQGVGSLRFSVISFCLTFKYFLRAPFFVSLYISEVLTKFLSDHLPPKQMFREMFVYFDSLSYDSFKQRKCYYPADNQLKDEISQGFAAALSWFFFFFFSQMNLSSAVY